MLQDERSVDKQFKKSCELIVKEEYIRIIKNNKNWYWKQLGTKESVIIAIHNVVNKCLDVTSIRDILDIPIGLRNKNRHKRLYKDIQFLYLILINIIVYFK